MAVPGKAPRFLTLTDVAEVLNTSSAQVYALVRRKELKAIKIGGRGQWRVEASELEAFIQRGRTLQPRAMGRGLRAAFRALFFNEEPVDRTEHGAVDWERLLGLRDGNRPADGASG